jgi:hypothetical protein
VLVHALDGPYEQTRPDPPPAVVRPHGHPRHRAHRHRSSAEELSARHHLGGAEQLLPRPRADEVLHAFGGYPRVATVRWAGERLAAEGEDGVGLVGSRLADVDVHRRELGTDTGAGDAASATPVRP